MTSEQSPPAERCLNCEHPLFGRFCAHCGQEAIADPPLRRWVGELIEDVFSVDARVWRTLRRLVAAPGSLSVEYRAGRRVRWIPPTRLYLVSSLFLFAAVELAPAPVVRVGLDSPSLAPATVAETRVRPESGFGGRVALAAADPERLNQIFVRGIAWLMFALIPVFALLLKAAWRRTGMLYLYHLVFALHIHTFVFLLMTLAFLVSHATAHLGEAGLQAPVRVAALTGGLYMVFAAWRFYPTTRAGTIFRMLLVTGSYALVVGAASLLVLGVVLLLFF